MYEYLFKIYFLLMRKKEIVQRTNRKIIVNISISDYFICLILWKRKKNLKAKLKFEEKNLKKKERIWYNSQGYQII
jgi:hypothetical protein